MTEQSPGCFARRMDRGAQAAPRQGEGVQPPARPVECGAAGTALGAGRQALCLRRARRPRNARGSVRRPLAAHRLSFHARAGLGGGLQELLFLGDNFNGIDVHLAHRDVTLVAVPRHRCEDQAFKQRMGWTLKWVSSAGCDFNQDYHVTFTPDESRRATSTTTTPG